jgi:hypothetical protein
MHDAAAPRFAGVVGSTWVGVLLGACASGLLLQRQWADDRPDLSIAAILTLYVLDAGLVVLSAVLALQLRYRSAPDIHTGMLRVGGGLVAGGLLSLAPAVAFATMTGFSDRPSVQGAEVLIVAACCLLGTAAGAVAWLATRRIPT